jgi:hypothetical protein
MTSLNTQANGRGLRLHLFKRTCPQWDRRRAKEAPLQSLLRLLVSPLFLELRAQPLQSLAPSSDSLGQESCKTLQPPAPCRGSLTAPGVWHMKGPEPVCTRLQGKGLHQALPSVISVPTSPNPYPSHRCRGQTCAYNDSWPLPLMSTLLHNPGASNL